MAGLDIDAMLSDFEKSKPVTKSKGLDIDSILSEFDAKPADIKPEAAKKTLDSGPSIRVEDFNRPDFGKKEVPRTRRILPTTNIEESISDAFKSGKEMVSSGLNDLVSNKPASGVGKIALGALGTAASPLTGLIEGGVATPVADVTGSKRIGDAVGMVAGLGLPVTKATKATIAQMPKNKALSTLVENIGQENLPAVVAAMKANPRLAPADLSPRVLQDTQHLFASEGPQIDYLAKASANRMANSKNAVIDAYDTTGGVSPDLAGKVQALADSAKKVGSEKINPAISNAGPVDISDTIAEIDKVLKPGVMSVVSGQSGLPLSNIKKDLAGIKAYLGTDKEVRTSAKDLHDFQAGLRRTAEELIRSQDGGSRQLGNALMNVRNNLVADIDKASGGKYKPALSSYRDEMHIADSFKDGYEGVFSSSKKMENDPSFTKKWFDGLTDAEKQAAREGARARVATEIGTARNPALAGESFSRSDFNQEKLSILFGKEEAAKLIKTLQEERTIANTHNKIIEGSQTAMRSASKSQFSMPTPTQVGANMLPAAVLEGANLLSGGIGGLGAATYTGARLAAGAKDAVKMKLAREHNARYAQYALPTEGPSRDALIAALEAQIPGPKPSLLSRGASSLSKIVSP